MKKIINISFVLITIFSISSGFAQHDIRLKGLEKDLNAVLDATKAPGFAVAIVEGKKIIYAKGFGYRDYEKKLPVDANTLFQIASCTKAFTASILGQLRQEDKISFDDSPIKYIPELRFFNDEMNNQITIKDLMCHRTGLPRHGISWYIFPSADKDSLLLRIAYQEPFTGVRQKWYYNNFMFLVQGVIAERITGKSWEENISERFFQPLKMTESSVSIEGIEKNSNAAVGYKLKNDSIIEKMDYYDDGGIGPAGSINSNVKEMSNWLITWINKGKFENQQILPQAYVEEAISPQMVIKASFFTYNDLPDMHLVNYGYAWFLSSYKGHYRVEHGGNTDGFSANVAFYPSDSLGIVVLTNQNGSTVPTLVRNIVADRILGTKRTNWIEWFTEKKLKAKKEKEETKTSSIRIKNTEPSHILQDYTGRYSNPGYGEFDITVQNDSLFANFKLKKLYLNHVHYDIFEPFEVTKTGIDTSNIYLSFMRFNFNTNNSGEISLVKINLEPALDHPIEFKRKPVIIDIDKTRLETYVGKYKVFGTTIKIYIKNENKLYLFTKGRPEYELLATDKHKFRALNGFKVEFVESDDGSITKMILILPNGKTFRARKK